MLFIIFDLIRKTEVLKAYYKPRLAKMPEWLSEK